MNFNFLRVLKGSLGPYEVYWRDAYELMISKQKKFTYYMPFAYLIKKDYLWKYKPQNYCICRVYFDVPLNSRLKTYKKIPEFFF